MSNNSNERGPQGEVEQLGVLRSNGGMESEVERSGITRVSVNDLLPQRTGILSTARNHAIGGPAVRLTDDAVVTHNGMDMTLKTAAQLGLVSRDASGNYTETPAGTTDAPLDADSTEEQQEAAKDIDTFSEATEAAAAQFASRFDSTVQEAIVEQIIQGGINNVDMKGAALGGMNPEQFRDGVGVTMHLFQDQADKFVAKRGAEPQDFYAWAKENHPDDLKDAMRGHIYGRKVGSYGQLLDRYFRSTPPSLEALKAGGYEVMMSPQGQAMVAIKGQWLSVAAAAKIGAI